MDTRSRLYEIVKKSDLRNHISEDLGRNYTNVPNRDLFDYILKKHKPQLDMLRLISDIEEHFCTKKTLLTAEYWRLKEEATQTEELNFDIPGEREAGLKILESIDFI